MGVRPLVLGSVRGQDRYPIGRTVTTIDNAV